MSVELHDALRALAAALPAGTVVPVPREELLDLVDRNQVVVPASSQLPATWRERIWTCPADTRLRAPEVAEAFGRPKSWVYRAVSSTRGAHRMPATRLAGELVFTAGTVRDWVKREETPT